MSIVLRLRRSKTSANLQLIRFPEREWRGMMEDAFDSLSGSPAVEGVAAVPPEFAVQPGVQVNGPTVGKPRTERNDYPKSLAAYPWTLDTRSIVKSAKKR